MLKKIQSLFPDSIKVIDYDFELLVQGFDGEVYITLDLNDIPHIYIIKIVTTETQKELVQLKRDFILLSQVSEILLKNKILHSVGFRE